MARVRIKFPRGTLKIKTYRALRTAERERRVPVVRIGRLYFTWWRNGQDRSAKT